MNQALPFVHGWMYRICTGETLFGCIHRFDVIVAAVLLLVINIMARIYLLIRKRD